MNKIKVPVNMSICDLDDWLEKYIEEGTLVHLQAIVESGGVGEKHKKLNHKYAEHVKQCIIEGLRESVEEEDTPRIIFDAKGGILKAKIYDIYCETIITEEIKWELENLYPSDEEDEEMKGMRDLRAAFVDAITKIDKVIDESERMKAAYEKLQNEEDES